MIINKGHWNRSDSVNDDFLCCLHISVMKTSYHVLPSMLFTALWLKINPTDSSPKCSWSFWVSTSAGGATVKDDGFSYRSGICAFDPTNKGMWKMCKCLQDFFFNAFDLLLFVFSIHFPFDIHNVCQCICIFFTPCGFTVSVAQELFYVIIFSFSILIFVKKKKKMSITLVSMSMSAVCAIIGSIVTKPAFVWFNFISDGK